MHGELAVFVCNMMANFLSVCKMYLPAIEDTQHIVFMDLSLRALCRSYISKSPSLTPQFPPASVSVWCCCCDVYRPVDDETCAACLAVDGEILSECALAIDFTNLDACEGQAANLCCFNEATGLDCVGNDAFWDYFTCGGVDLACDERTCGAGTGVGGGTPPTPSTTAATPAPAADVPETVAPTATADGTVAPAEAGSMTAAPNSASFLSSEDTPEPTPATEGGGGGGDGVTTLEPTSAAERAITITAAPTTAGEAEDTDASGTSGAGLGVSRSPAVGLVAAGLVIVVALVGV